MKFYLYILLFHIILSLVLCIKNKSPKKAVKRANKKEIINKQIISILLWAKKNNIYINQKLKLNKNENSSHNFFYFTSNSSIPKGTTLLKVPYSILISQNTLYNKLIANKNKKWCNIWDKIIKSENHHIIHFSIKQYLYISLILENAMDKRRGIIYKKYEPYLNMYEDINLDNFPIFYDEDEIEYLSLSNFGSQLMRDITYLKEEYYEAKNELKITSTMLETFLKYRVLSFANSIGFINHNSMEGYNESVVVPFIDCFQKIIPDGAQAMAQYSMKKNDKNEYFFEIVSTKDIKNNQEISLEWKKLSNQDSLLYYGFIQKDNKLLSTFYVNVFNDIFKGDLGVDINKNFSDIAKRDLYDINSELLESDVVQSYKNISMLFDKYKNKKEGRYEMMVDNLFYYLNVYDKELSEGNINLHIKGNNKRKIIKELMKIEKSNLINKINYIKSIIQDIKERNHNIDDL
jgi:hypothetical protein